MAGLIYLWKHRVKSPVISIRFYKTWAKRLLSLPELIKRNHRRITLQRAGAQIDTLAEIGKVNILGKRDLLQVGKLSFLGRVKISLHEKVIIGSSVCINDGVEILTASHDVLDPEWNLIKKSVTIEDYVWIGTGAMILPGVKLGRGCVVGARAVVTKNVEPFTIVAGNPAKVLSKKREEKLTYNPCAFVAANRAWLVG